jgi:hypothetical protein
MDDEFHAMHCSGFSSQTSSKGIVERKKKKIVGQKKKTVQKQCMEFCIGANVPVTRILRRHVRLIDKLRKKKEKTRLMLCQMMKEFN